jgi:RNase P subunit RPR2
MIAALETFRAIICHRCAKPIRISQKLENRASLRASEGKDIESQVFVLRCRSCERESVYSINQIVDFPKS